MPAWKGIVARGFAPTPFIDYVNALTFPQWRPKKIVLHNTYIPSLALWKQVGAQQYLRNLEKYYRDKLEWSAGPHLFIDDRAIWVFTPLTTPGVHSPSYNHNAWGVETVGDYDREPLLPETRNNVTSALATLMEAMGLDPREDLVLHKEDPATDHKGCPGKHIVKPEMIAAVVEKLAKRRGGDHLASRPDFSTVVSGSSTSVSTSVKG